MSRLPREMKDQIIKRRAGCGEEGRGKDCKLITMSFAKFLELQTNSHHLRLLLCLHRRIESSRERP